MCDCSTHPHRARCEEGKRLLMKLEGKGNTFWGNSKGLSTNEIDDRFVARQLAEQAFMKHCQTEKNH